MKTILRSPESPTPAGEAAPEPPPKKTRRPRQVINRAHLDEIAHSRAVAKAATDPVNASLLTKVALDTALVTQINALADSVEKKIGKLTGARAGKTDMTAQEQAARDQLVAFIAPVQTAARRAFYGQRDHLQSAYFIGENLAHDHLAEVITAAKAIRDRLVPGPNNTPPADVLPGIGAAEIQALSNAITTLGQDAGAREQQNLDNSKALADIENDLHTLATLRHQVQLAADQAAPWRAPGAAPMRKAFLLPENQPVK